MEEGRQLSAPALLKAALAYAGRGVPVFPCEPGAKRPLTRNGHWDATTDRRTIERWWGRQPSANIGLPTGKKSGIVVLDVDVDDGGLESLAKLEGAGLLGPGLDVRCEGGYVVVPPSRTHGAYEWADRSPLAKASWLTERDGATLF